MKKRVLSMLLAFILCFSTLPMTAFAQEADAVAEQEEQQETDSAAEQEEAEAAAAPGEETPADKSTTAATPGTEDSTAGEAPDTVEPSVESVSDSDAGTQDTSADDEKKAAVQKVQALIDALPDEVTVENAESVGAQLEAIDEAMKCKETGEAKTIVFGLTGTGYFDMVAYEKFHNGEMTDYIPTDAELGASFATLPKVPGQD